MLRHLLRTVNLFDTATIALFLGFLAACGQSGESSRGLVYYESYDPRSLDPALSTDVPTGEMVTLLYDGLTQFDPDGRLLPGLADRWTADARAQRYVFHLRHDVMFHDVRPLVAADVKRSFLRVLEPRTRGGRVWPLLPIAGADDFVAKPTTIPFLSSKLRQWLPQLAWPAAPAPASRRSKFCLPPVGRYPLNVPLDRGPTFAPGDSGCPLPRARQPCHTTAAAVS